LCLRLGGRRGLGKARGGAQHEGEHQHGQHQPGRPDHDNAFHYRKSFPEDIEYREAFDFTPDRADGYWCETSMVYICG
jgi:hypothetical protein